MRAKARGKQQGITLPGLVFVLAVLVLLGYVGLRLFPIYSESFRIDASLDGLAKDEDLTKLSRREIIQALVRRLEINGVRRISERNYREYVDIEQRAASTILSVRYTAEARLFDMGQHSLSLLARFEKTREEP